MNRCCARPARWRGTCAATCKRPYSSANATIMTTCATMAAATPAVRTWCACSAIKPGALTFAGDFLKAVAAVLLGGSSWGRWADISAGCSWCSGIASRRWRGSRGGKGVASSLAVAWMVFPLGAAATSVTAALLLLLTKAHLHLLACGRARLCRDDRAAAPHGTWRWWSSPPRCSRSSTCAISITSAACCAARRSRSSTEVLLFARPRSYTG